MVTSTNAQTRGPVVNMDMFKLGFTKTDSRRYKRMVELLRVLIENKAIPLHRRDLGYLVDGG